MKAPTVQNESGMLPAIQKAGCLFRSLIYLAEDFVWNEIKAGPLSVEAVKEVYFKLVALHEKDRYRGIKPNTFVMYHTDVIEYAGEALGVQLNAFYIESVSYDEKRVRPYRSALEVVPNAWITHRELLNGTGHFMVAKENHEVRFDPFFPATNYGRELSFRSYRIEVKE